MNGNATERFNTNPQTIPGLPMDRLICARMIVKEVYMTSATPPARTGVIRCRLWNGTIESKRDFFVLTKSTTTAVGADIFAARPIGGTGKKQTNTPVEWIDVSGVAGGATFPAGGRQWDVLTKLDDAGAVGWTRPRFTNS